MAGQKDFPVPVISSELGNATDAMTSRLTKREKKREDRRKNNSTAELSQTEKEKEEEENYKRLMQDLAQFSGKLKALTDQIIASTEKASSADGQAITGQMLVNHYKTVIDELAELKTLLSTVKSSGSAKKHEHQLALTFLYRALFFILTTLKNIRNIIEEEDIEDYKSTDKIVDFLENELKTNTVKKLEKADEVLSTTLEVLQYQKNTLQLNVMVTEYKTELEAAPSTNNNPATRNTDHPASETKHRAVGRESEQLDVQQVIERNNATSNKIKCFLTVLSITSDFAYAPVELADESKEKYFTDDLAPATYADETLTAMHPSDRKLLVVTGVQAWCQTNNVMDPNDLLGTYEEYMESGCVLEHFYRQLSSAVFAVEQNKDKKISGKEFSELASIAAILNDSNANPLGPQQTQVIKNTLRKVIVEKLLAAVNSSGDFNSLKSLFLEQSFSYGCYNALSTLNSAPAESKSEQFTQETVIERVSAKVSEIACDRYEKATDLDCLKSAYVEALDCSSTAGLLTLDSPCEKVFTGKAIKLLSQIDSLEKLAEEGNRLGWDELPFQRPFRRHLKACLIEKIKATADSENQLGTLSEFLAPQSAWSKCYAQVSEGSKKSIRTVLQEKIREYSIALLKFQTGMLCDGSITSDDFTTLLQGCLRPVLDRLQRIDSGNVICKSTVEDLLTTYAVDRANDKNSFIGLLALQSVLSEARAGGYVFNDNSTFHTAAMRIAQAMITDATRMRELASIDVFLKEKAFATHFRIGSSDPAVELEKLFSDRVKEFGVSFNSTSNSADDTLHFNATSRGEIARFHAFLFALKDYPRYLSVSFDILRKVLFSWIPNSVSEKEAASVSDFAATYRRLASSAKELSVGADTDQPQDTLIAEKISRFMQDFLDRVHRPFDAAAVGSLTSLEEFSEKLLPALGVLLDLHYNQKVESPLVAERKTQFESILSGLVRSLLDTSGATPSDSQLALNRLKELQLVVSENTRASVPFLPKAFPDDITTLDGKVQLFLNNQDFFTPEARECVADACVDTILQDEPLDASLLMDFFASVFSVQEGKSDGKSKFAASVANKVSGMLSKQISQVEKFSDFRRYDEAVKRLSDKLGTADNGAYGVICCSSALRLLQEKLASKLENPKIKRAQLKFINVPRRDALKKRLIEKRNELLGFEQLGAGVHDISAVNKEISCATTLLNQLLLLCQEVQNFSDDPDRQQDGLSASFDAVSYLGVAKPLLKFLTNYQRRLLDRASTTPRVIQLHALLQRSHDMIEALSPLALVVGEKALGDLKGAVGKMLAQTVSIFGRDRRPTTEKAVAKREAAKSEAKTAKQKAEAVAKEEAEEAAQTSHTL